MRIRSLYGTSNVSIDPNNTTKPDIYLKGAQLVVDSTGKAQDVLKRVQVRLSLNTTLNVPDFAVQAGAGLCKRYNVVSNGASPSITLGAGAGNSSDPNNPCSVP
jgi:hypothetical protein